MKVRANWRELLVGIVGNQPLAPICRRAKLNPAYLRDIFERHLQPRIENAEKLSAALSVPLTDWFLEPDANDTTARRIERGLEIAVAPAQLSRDVPVFGTAQGGDDGAFHLNNGEVIDYVRRPERLAGLREAFALYVVGNSVSPWREEGQIVYVLPRQPVKIGDYVVVQLRSTGHGETPRALVKRLVKLNEREVVLEQFKPQKLITLPKRSILSIDRVIDWSELLGV